MTTQSKITTEVRGHILLIGIRRGDEENRIDPETLISLSRTLFAFQNDPSQRAAVLFGHGPNFSRGIDVPAFQAFIAAGQKFPDVDVISPVGTSGERRTKPLVVAVHGDTWNGGHEFFLAADIRVAARNTRFFQNECYLGRFPAGGATVRFVREVGWGNAMRYMLTGDTWGVEEASRMGLLQEVVETAADALARAIDIAEKIAACAPLGVQATMKSAQSALTSDDVVYAKLLEQYFALYQTEDFKEGRKASEENRPPIYQGR